MSTDAWGRLAILLSDTSADLLGQFKVIITSSAIAREHLMQTTSLIRLTPLILFRINNIMYISSLRYLKPLYFSSLF